MNLTRCDWAGTDPLYIEYHDNEWGVPVHNDQRLFEMLILEGAQAGLSWITVLRKRKAYREAFDNFDYKKISNYSEEKINELLSNEGIIRNKLKIRSVIKNAKAFIKIQDEFGSFDQFIWNHINNKTIQNRFNELSQIPAQTELSQKISKDLLKRGLTFVGPTIIYSFMQAVGMTNDHLLSCFRFERLSQE